MCIRLRQDEKRLPKLNDDPRMPTTLFERISTRIRISRGIRWLVGGAIPLVLGMRFMDQSSPAFTVAKAAVLLIGAGVSVSTIILAVNQRRIDELVRTQQTTSDFIPPQMLEVGDGTGASVRLYHLGTAASLLVVFALACSGSSVVVDFLLVFAFLALAVLGVFAARTWRELRVRGHTPPQQARTRDSDTGMGNDPH